MHRKRLNRKQKKAETRALLLKSASMVFKRRGLQGASLEEIAEEAGFSRGAVYSNFKNKEDLFLALGDERNIAWERVFSEKLETTEQSPEARAREAGQLIADVLDEDSKVFPLDMEFWSHAIRNEKLRCRLAKQYDELRLSIAKIFDAQLSELGITSPVPTEDIATVISALLEGFMLQMLIDPERFPPEFNESVFSELLVHMFKLGEVDRTTGSAA